MSGQSPNIVLITCHDLGRFLGAYGVSTVRTPNLDRLAAEGIQFNQAFCAAPQCSPSRAALFTGRYPHTNGVMGLTHADFAWDLHVEEEHLAQVLQRAGYATAVVGILHESRDAQRCGFQQVVPPGWGVETSERALETLASLVDRQPFYLQVGYHEVHRVEGSAEDQVRHLGFAGDYIAPDAELGVTVPPYLHDDPEAREEVAELQGAVRYLDDAVGRVLAGLPALGLAEQTLVIFTTDHGLPFPRAKCSLYDPGIEIALLLRFPTQGWTDGRTVAPLVSNVDLFPTLLDLVALPVHDRVQGQSLLPLLNGQVTAHRDCVFGEMTYHDYYHPQRCIRTERYKLIVNFSTAPAFMDPSQSWYRRTRPQVPAKPGIMFTPAIELYDLEADSLEWQNLAEDPAHTAVRQDLLARLAEWMRTTGDPLLQGAVTSPRHHRVVDALDRARDASEPRT